MLKVGDRIAYSAKFLKNTGQFTGSGPQRRGTLISLSQDNKFARVRWDDFESNADYYTKQYGEDYTEEARKNGQMGLVVNIAKVGSPKFALNDI